MFKFQCIITMCYASFCDRYLFYLKIVSLFENNVVYLSK